MRVYASLADPDAWKMRPAEIADLTDWQIDWLYLRPAAERAERAEDKAGPVTDPFEGGLPPRAEFASQMIRTDGRTADHWNRVYDGLEAELKARAGG